LPRPSFFYKIISLLPRFISRNQVFSPKPKQAWATQRLNFAQHCET